MSARLTVVVVDNCTASTKMGPTSMVAKKISSYEVTNEVVRRFWKDPVGRQALETGPRLTPLMSIITCIQIMTVTVKQITVHIQLNYNLLDKYY